MILSWRIWIGRRGDSTGKEVFIVTKEAEEQKNILLHRNKIYAAEMSRLAGEPVYTPEELEKKMELLFLRQEENQ